MTRLVSHLARVVLLLAAALPAPGAEPDPDDPPVCREALARHPDATALEALAEEEKRVAREARTAQRRARKLMHDHLGTGSAVALRLPEYDALTRRVSEAKRVGKALCYCRERRGDPHREDCERLYPEVIR